MSQLHAVDPSTGETFQSYPRHSDAETSTLIEAAQARFETWRDRPFGERAALLRKVAQLLREQKSELASLMAREMGKPVGSAVAEAEKCAWVCEHYAEHAEGYLAPEDIETSAVHSFVRYDPLGVILAVMPWNFPFWQVFRFAAPCLMAGNVGVLKHASNVPGCGLAIERLFREAGFPAGCFTTLMISSSQVEQVIRHPAVKACALTGSEAAGSQVAATAGSEIKKCVLELGGSDPFIVLEDADVARAVKVGITARCLNNGQSCIAAKRFLVHEAVLEEFSAGFVAGVRALKIGNALDPATDIGPLARPDLVDDLERQVQGSLQAGARLLCGGQRLERPGYFYQPTVLGDVRPGMPAADEETFGPLAALIRVENEAQAIALANSSPYGLGASLWTADRERGKRLARQIEAGCVFINEMVKSDPRVPFGGVKLSGFGRELGRPGILEFVNSKTVWVL